MSETKPQVVIIAGPNGAGKSTLAPILLRDTFGLLEFVNADTISTGLSAFNSEAVAFEAGRVMLDRLHSLARNNKSFAFESTLASRSYAPWIKQLRADGYEFHLLFVSLCNENLAKERVAERVRSGGHRVPDDVISRRYARGLSNFFNLYQALANTWAIYDNSTIGAPLLVAAGGENILSVIPRYGMWWELLTTWRRSWIAYGADEVKNDI